MKRSTSGSYWRRSIRVGGLWLALLAGGTTLAEPLPPPGGLYNAGDYYLYRDRSSVPLWRSTNEIALRRHKALSQGTALAAAGGKAVLLSVDAFATNAIEIYTVDDAAKAVQNLNARNEIAWVSPMLAVPGAGSRLLLSDEVSVQLREGADVDATLAEIARRGLQIVRMPLPSGPGLYLLRFSSPKAVDALAETRSLMNVPGIAWAEPNFIAEMQFYFTPNDQFLGRQQGLHNTGTNGGVLGADVHCPEAWDVKRGNANLVIAIIDTGVDTSHPDLSIFRNDNE